MQKEVQDALQAIAAHVQVRHENPCAALTAVPSDVLVALRRALEFAATSVARGLDATRTAAAKQVLALLATDDVAELAAKATEATRRCAPLLVSLPKKGERQNAREIIFFFFSLSAHLRVALALRRQTGD